MLTLISQDATLVFDPDIPPIDKRFAIVNIDDTYHLKLLLEHDKGEFAVSLFNEKANKKELKMLDSEKQILALLTEIRFK